MSSTEKRDTTRRVPFVALRTYLGDTNKIVSHRMDGAEHFRRWECGCTAVLRSSNKSARWRPCKAHANTRDPVPSPVDPDRPRAASYVRRRVPPRFFIVDRELRVLSIAAGSDIEPLIPEALLRLAEGEALSEATLVALDDETWLRTVPLEGAWANGTVVFVESGGMRGSIERAAQQFGLSKREMDVLRLVLDNRSNADIARALFIADSTVGDHIKSIYRKTQSTRRTELVGKLLQGEI